MDFRFTFEDETWAVDDQYCVQRQCSCTEATLTFLKLAGHSVPGSRTLGCGPVLGYDYSSRKTKRVGNPQMQSALRTDLLEAVQAAHPKLDTFLRLRHEILKILYLRDELARAQAYLKTLPSLVRPKVGRNDPCPCGSGRKYKRCCLNNPTP